MSLYQTFLAVTLLSLHAEGSSGIGTWGEGLLLFVVEVGGAVVLVFGWLISQTVRRIDEPLAETTMTVITAYGVYLLADLLHLSVIIAVIVATLALSARSVLVLGDQAKETQRVQPMARSWQLVIF